MLERELEDKLVKYAVSKRVVTYKFTCPAQRGVPDRIFIGPKGTVFVELKRPGARITKMQKYHIDRINNAGGTAFWTDSVEGGKKIIDGLLEG